MILTNLAFLSAFASTFCETLLLAASGGFLGLALDSVLRICRWRNTSVAVFLRIISWIPFFVFFALPLETGNTVLAVSLLGTIAVGLYTCSNLFSARTINPNDWHGFIRDVTKCTIIRGLLFSLFTDLRSQTGWIHLFNQKPGPEIIFSAMIVLTVFVFLLDRLLQYNFYDNARAYSLVLNGELTMNKVASFFLLLSIAIVCFLLWQITGEYLQSTQANQLSLGVIGWFIQLVIGNTDAAANLRKDLIVSNLEVWGGLFVSGGLSLLLSKVLSHESISAKLIVCVISMTLVSPIILPMLLPFFGINRVGDFSLSTMISIAFLTLFPLLKVLQALRDYRGLLAAIVGFRVAISLAYIGMLVGELYGAVAGLGFRIVSEQASGHFLTAMAVSLITVTSLLLSILILHCASASKRYNHSGSSFVI